jgi:prepilin-type N-terminal cleavage/methylation domain-containing protein
MTSLRARVGRRAHGAVSDDSGFTLLEVITTAVLLGIATALIVGPWRTFGQAQAQRDMAQQLVAILRNAQASSVAEVATYRVDITSTAAASYRLNPGTGIAVLKQRIKSSNSSVVLASPSFQDADGATSSSVFFYPKGSASKGEVKVLRSGTDKVYTVSVEGLTARVSYTD